MGNFPDMSKIITVGQLTDELKISPDRMRKRIVRLHLQNPDIFPDKSAASDRPLSIDEVKALSGKLERKKSGKAKKDIRTEATTTVHPPALAAESTPVPPGRQKRLRWPTRREVVLFFFNTLAIAIVCGHGFMIWQEAAELYGYLGNVGGAIVFAVVCLAVLIASDSSRVRTSGNALWFMLCVDAAAGFVHYEALHTPSVPNAMTVGFCLFICACSFVALLLYRDSKLD